MIRYLSFLLFVFPALALAEDRLPAADYHRQPTDPEWLAQVVQFHGHLGPGLSTGRAGDLTNADARPEIFWPDAIAVAVAPSMN
jgi:hypothetical protein